MELSEKGEEILELAREVQQYRKDNGGFVPRSIFPQVLAVGGQIVCCDLVAVDTEGKVAVRLRDSKEEQGWQGQYHLPGGLVLSGHKTEKDFLKRSLTQIFNGEISLEPHFLGVERHTESERYELVGFTLVYRLDIPGLWSDYAGHLDQAGDWKFISANEVKDNNFPLVIHHRGTILRALGFKEASPDSTQFFIGC